MEQQAFSVTGIVLDRRVQHRLCLFAVTVGYVALTVAAVVLIGGWVLGIDALKGVLPGFATMKVNTAIGVGMLGAALLMATRGPSKRPIERLPAIVALMLGVVTLTEYAVAWDAGIDELFIKDVATPLTSAPGRPAAATATMIALLGAALLCAGRPAVASVRTFSAVTASLIAWATLNLYIFGARALHEVQPFSSVALHTAIILLMLGLGVLAIQPVPRLVRVAFASGTSGRMYRLLLPLAILAPPVLGWLLSREGKMDLFPTRFDWGLYSVMSTLGSVWLILVLVDRMFAIDSERSAVTKLAHELRQALDDREIFKAVIENSSDFIGISNPEGRPVYLNPAARRMVGLDVGIPIERLEECYSPELRSFAADLVLDKMRTHGRWEGETQLRHFGGQQTIPVSDARFIVRESGTGRILGSAAISRDISEIKRAQEEREATNRKLEELNRRLQRINERQTLLADAGRVFASPLDSEKTLTSVARLAVRDFADHCVVKLADERGEMRRFVVVSREPSLAWACEVLSKSPLNPDRPYLGSETFRTHRSILMEIPSPEAIDSFAQDDVERLRALRAMHIRSVITVPLAANGKQFGVLAFLAAESSAILNEEDLQLAETLAMRAALSLENARLYEAVQHAVQARDEVLGIVAHDLRSPLNLIVMEAAMLQLAQTGQGGRTSSAATMIHRSAERMNRLIQDLLDITRVEAGCLTIEYRRLPPREVAAESVDVCRARAVAKSVELRLEALAGLPEVWGDRERLIQVLENLIANAIRFTGPGGSVTVSAVPIVGEVLFSVADTGVGIGAEELRHVFDRFWQARQGKRNGVGLGLAIVKAIIEAHGGRVWATSTPGQGTTFFFTVSRAPQVVGAPDRVAQTP